METNSDQQEEEFGDLLFSLVNYARFIDLSPESALSKTNQKFIRRFQLMEELIQQDLMDIKNMDLEQMDQYWDKAKISLKKGAR
jgi:XTP/dITP diphosphohydrolase